MHIISSMESGNCISELAVLVADIGRSGCVKGFSCSREGCEKAQEDGVLMLVREGWC